MTVLLLLVFRFVRLLLSGHQAVAIENAALRNANRRLSAKAEASAADDLGPDVLDYPPESVVRLRQPLLYVQADTVVRWQRERFGDSGRGCPSRSAASRSAPHHRRTPPIDLTDGRRQSAVARTQNSWRTQDARYRHFRAHCLAHPAQAPSAANQTWTTFLHNHVGQMVSTDFFTLPTITMKVLFVFIVLEHERRKVPHFNVTEHPTGAWTAQQIVEAFADREAAQYLIRDRDSRYSAEVRLRIKSLGMQEILTAPQSPRQNPYAERLIGSIRRECLNHCIILNARHLKRTLSSYFRYYHESENPLEPGQAMSVPSRGVEGWTCCRHSTTRRPSSPLRTYRRIAIFVRIDDWGTSASSKGWHVQWETVPPG